MKCRCRALTYNLSTGCDMGAMKSRVAKLRMNNPVCRINSWRDLTYRKAISTRHCIVRHLQGEKKNTVAIHEATPTVRPQCEVDP